MKMKAKKITILLLGVFAFATGFYFLPAKQYKKINPKIKFQKLVNSQEEGVWNSLQSIGITKATISDCYKREIKEYRQLDKAVAAKTLPKNILSLIHKTMIDCNINPQAVTIALTDDDSHATATDSVLYINKKMFGDLSLEAQQFVLAHEFAHMHYKDNSTTCAIDKAFEEKHISKKNTADFPRNIYARFKEIRADIRAALTSPEYARSYVAFMKETIKAHGENRGISHPKNSERLALAQEIYAALKTA